MRHFEDLECGVAETMDQAVYWPGYQLRSMGRRGALAGERRYAISNELR